MIGLCSSKEVWDRRLSPQGLENPLLDSLDFGEYRCLIGVVRAVNRPFLLAQRNHFISATTQYADVWSRETLGQF
jgi:hypothetical protein